VFGLIGILTLRNNYGMGLIYPRRRFDASIRGLDVVGYCDAPPTDPSEAKD
jgi:hypothetical protein